MFVESRMSIRVRNIWIAGPLALGSGCGSAMLQTSHKTCVDPRTFGAIVDDSKDDRAAVQAAIDAAAATHADVCLPAGELDIARRPGIGLTSIPSLILSGDGAGIIGVGPASRLVMLDQVERKNDWWVLEVTGAHHELRGFALDGSKRGITDEQTHLIQVVGPASSLHFDQLELSIPVLPDTKGGDCIRMLGEANAPVRDVSITAVEGRACARSFIAFQRFVSNVVVDRVRSYEIGGSAIDMEPSGDGAIHDVTIRRSSFKRGDVTRGGAAIQLSGTRDLQSSNISVEDSYIESGIWIYQTSQVRLLRNRIEGGQNDRPLVQLVKHCSNIEISDNELERHGTPGDGIALSLREHEWPTNVTIKKNHILMATDGFPIHAEPVVTIDVVGNSIECPAENDTAAIYLRGVEVGISEATVRDNTLKGCATAVRVAQYQSNSTGAVKIENNDIQGARVGVQFENGTPSVRPVIDRNRFHGVEAAHHALGLEQGFSGSNATD